MAMKRRKWLTIPLQVAAWALYFALPHLMRPDQRFRREHHPEMHVPHPDSTFWMYYSMLQHLPLIPIFYLNVYYLLPRLLQRRKYALLVLAELICFGFHYAYNIALSNFLLPDAPMGPRLFFGLTNYMLIFAVAYGVYAYSESQRIEELQQEREVETMKAELQFLRWQISPHFLFNALNNMVALARKKSDDLEPMLIHLSGLMRYMIYETDSAKVSLQKECEYLQSYIRLQSIRYSNVTLGIHLDVPENRTLRIEPMLLIPFVENAFKHGIDGVENPVIRVQLSVQGNAVRLEVANKYVAGAHYNKDDAHGVGLANVQRRLNLLYADRYSLETTVDNWYTVHLKIELA
jgi:hypothetical protein